jgi:ADP-ribose pyrophosphatase
MKSKENQPAPIEMPENGYPDHPRVAIGAVVFKDNEVLLVRRGKAPSQDLWAIPGGKVRLGESLQQAAEREIKEETGIIIRAREPVFIFDHVEYGEHDRVLFHYVIVDLIADYLAGQPAPGDDALEARWISSENLKHLKVSKKTLELLLDRFNFGL